MTAERIGEELYLHIYDYETETFSAMTTYHGLVRIYQSRNWPSRIIWTLAVTTALISFILHSGTLLYSYHLRPTATQVNMIVPREGVRFPDITICNLNPVDKSKTADWNMTDQVLEYVLKCYAELGSLEEMSSRELLAQNEAFIDYTKSYKQITGKDFDFKTFFNSTGHSCSEMVKSCNWAGQKLDNCCSLTVDVMTDVGKCLKFTDSSGHLLYQKISGVYYGLHVLIDIRIDQMLHVNYFDAGIKFYAHPETALPFLQSNAVAAPPGTKIYGSVSLRNISLLRKDDWGLCSDVWDEEKYGKKLIEGVYSAAHCEANCLANAFLRSCGCVPISKRFDDTLTVCSPFQVYNCTHEKAVIYEFGSVASANSRQQTDVFWHQSCNCDVECNRLEYSVSTSYSNLAAGKLEDQFGHNFSYIKKNYVSVNVYMQSMGYEKHIQGKQLNRADLLSNIAGSMGLFLGMSIVTILEILIYLIKSFYGAFNSQRKKKIETKLSDHSTTAKKSLVPTSSNNSFANCADDAEKCSALPESSKKESRDTTCHQNGIATRLEYAKEQQTIQCHSIPNIVINDHIIWPISEFDSRKRSAQST